MGNSFRQWHRLENGSKVFATVAETVAFVSKNYYLVMGSLKANLIQRMEYMCCTEALVIFVYLKHHTYIDPNHPLTSDMEIKTKYTKINFSRLLRLVVLPLPHLHDSQWSGQGALYISYLFIWSHVQLITFYRSLGASTCYSAASCHVSQFSSWGRRPERGTYILFFLAWHGPSGTRNCCQQ